jgi:hypothetical protein
LPGGVRGRGGRGVRPLWRQRHVLRAPRAEGASERGRGGRGVRPLWRQRHVLRARRAFVPQYRRVSLLDLRAPRGVVLGKCSRSN